MLVYILKSAACLAILFLFYKLFLERENMHVFKRFYLLASLTFALIIPTIVFTEYVETPAQTFAVIESQQTTNTSEVINVPQALESDIVDLAPILWTVYFLGLLFFGIKFLKNLFQIFRRIRLNPKQKLARFTQVLLQEKIPPHTFFSYIFLNKAKLESNEIPKEVILHEETHAAQKHSWDVVFVEFLCVIFWINPFIHLTKKAIKLNHEFLADQAVLKKDIDKVTYQNTLLSYLSPDSEKKYQPSLANAINYSSTRLTVFGKTFTFGSAVGQVKKRFTVMKKITSRKSVLLRSFLLLPLLATLLYGFSETKIVQERRTAEQKNDSETVMEHLPNQKGATEEQTKEYNALAKKYNAVPIEKRIIPLNDLKILETVYRKMNTDQRGSSQPFPECQQVKSGIEILINKRGQLLFDGQVVKIEELPIALSKFNSNLSKEEREKSVRSVIKVNDETSKSIIERVEQILGEYGVAQINIMGPEINSVSQDGASRKQMAEYNQLARHYNNMPKSNMRIKMKDVERLKYIYGLMSDKQRADAEPFPDFPEPPPMPDAPKAPKSPKAKKGEKSDIPPLPPPTPDEVDFEEVEEIIDSQEINAVHESVEQMFYSHQTPPSPPAPKSPLDHVIEMAKKDAIFYYEGKEVSSDRAIELLKKNKTLNIDSRASNLKRPIVKISKDPIIIEN